MSDIFISYSSKDREKAEQLTELLASAGLSVWIDQLGIDVATSWSGEIVDAITDCKAFVILLSPNSVLSENVIKEVSLAASRKKKILPLDLEPVGLPRDLEYHLAGIQRAPMTNIDAIIRALGKLGLEATQAPTMKLVKETDGRKSLMILPFEDLSPTADNEWFTNGIVSELINAFSNIRSLRVIDTQTTKEFRSYKGHLTVFAREMTVRYFVQGDVRKFGDQIRIASRLLDIEIGEYLWQDTLKGTMEDIFDMQEAVARSVVAGLSIVLSREEEEKLDSKTTNNTEAYELWLKGKNYHGRHTRADFERAHQLYEEAILRDPTYVDAHISAANVLMTHYRFYDRDPATLDKAEAHIRKAMELDPESPQVFWMRSRLSLRRGDLESSLQYAQRAIAIDPNSSLGYDSLAFAYEAMGKKEEGLKARKMVVELNENHLHGQFNYLQSLLEFLGSQSPEFQEAFQHATPFFERHIRLSPEDLNTRANFVYFLGHSSERERAMNEAAFLESSDRIDGLALYTLGCMHILLNDLQLGFKLLRRSISKGFVSIEDFTTNFELNGLRDTAEFTELMKQLESSSTKD
ncbi:MAG: TIR domain-containing protein [Ignavibacteriota bacterium]